jgi:hypothetical protein
MNVVVTQVPDGIPPRARVCDLPWFLPPSAQPAQTCRRRPDVQGSQRMDRVFSNLVVLYAWKDDTLLEVSFRNSADGVTEDRLPIGTTARTSILVSLLPLLDADLDG